MPGDGPRKKKRRPPTYEAPTTPDTLGHAVREARCRRGWVQQDLADAADITQTQVSRIELGVIQRPGKDTVRAIATALDLPPGRLLELANWPGALLLPDEVTAALQGLMPDALENLRLFALVLAGADLTSDEIPPEFVDRLLGYARALSARDAYAVPDASASAP